MSCADPPGPPHSPILVTLEPCPCTCILSCSSDCEPNGRQKTSMLSSSVFPPALSARYLLLMTPLAMANTPVPP
uniref:Uncharacterized protein n=1 Tax=Zea mays TaxID=4577 RepID=C4J4D7_MAIZE|nr:unknown [Zea mays]